MGSRDWDEMRGKESTFHICLRKPRFLQILETKRRHFSFSLNIKICSSLFQAKRTTLINVKRHRFALGFFHLELR